MMTNEEAKEAIDNSRRDKRLAESIRRTMEEHAELLEKLNDYDKNGTPYWEQQIHD